MKMVLSTRLAVVATLVASLTSAGFAQISATGTKTPAGLRTEESYTDLTDDVSRQSAFDQIIVPTASKTIAPTGSLAIPSNFTFPTDARTDTILHKPRTNSIFSIDLSHHNAGEIPYDLLRSQGVRMVYVKATQGTTGKDGTFAARWKKLGELQGETRVARGAYMFLSPATPGIDQADAFVDYINLHGGFKADDLPPVLDLEWAALPPSKDVWETKTTAYILRETLACLARIEQRTGRIPILYTAASWWTSKTIPAAQVTRFAAYPFWYADYNPKRKLSEKPSLLPGHTSTMWQFTDRAGISIGYSKIVDASIFYGSEQDFKKTFGQ